MANVTYIRETKSDEPGTHYIEFEQFKGPDTDSVHGELYIEQTGGNKERIEGTVVDGCEHGLDLHYKGNLVYVQRIIPTDGHFLASAEN